MLTAVAVAVAVALVWSAETWSRIVRATAATPDTILWAASLRVVGIASFGVGTSRVRETARVTWGSGA